MAQHQAEEDALPERGLRPVPAGREARASSRRAILLAEQEHTFLGGELTAVETSSDMAAFAAWKRGGGRGTFRHSGCGR